jgi:hypothetical protein
MFIYLLGYYFDVACTLMVLQGSISFLTKIFSTYDHGF